MQTIPEQIAYIGRMLFERRLTDISGGNISVREGDNIYITPRFSGGRKHWQLEPEDILCGRVSDDNILENPLFSREGKMHLAIYRKIPIAGAVIHSHPFHVLPFCSTGKSIVPVLENSEKFGEIECVQPAPAHSADLADNVVNGFLGKEARIVKMGAAVLIPMHGIVAVSRDIFSALDTVERIDWNAWCLLARHWID
jgi:L-fuculose-phosphate aldolase